MSIVAALDGGANVLASAGQVISAVGNIFTAGQQIAAEKEIAIRTTEAQQEETDHKTDADKEVADHQISAQTEQSEHADDTNLKIARGQDDVQQQALKDQFIIDQEKQGILNAQAAEQLREQQITFQQAQDRVKQLKAEQDAAQRKIDSNKHVLAAAFLDNVGKALQGLILNQYNILIVSDIDSDVNEISDTLVTDSISLQIGSETVQFLYVVADSGTYTKSGANGTDVVWWYPNDARKKSSTISGGASYTYTFTPRTKLPGKGLQPYDEAKQGPLMLPQGAQKAATAAATAKSINDSLHKTVQEDGLDGISSDGVVGRTGVSAPGPVGDGMHGAPPNGAVVGAENMAPVQGAAGDDYSQPTVVAGGADVDSTQAAGGEGMSQVAGGRSIGSEPGTQTGNELPTRVGSGGGGGEGMGTAGTRSKTSLFPEGGMVQNAAQNIT